MTPEQMLQMLADLEYDRLREDGFYSLCDKQVFADHERKEREAISGKNT